MHENCDQTCKEDIEDFSMKIQLITQQAVGKINAANIVYQLVVMGAYLAYLLANTPEMALEVCNEALKDGYEQAQNHRKSNGK